MPGKQCPLYNLSDHLLLHVAWLLLMMATVCIGQEISHSTYRRHCEGPVACKSCWHTCFRVLAERRSHAMTCSPWSQAVMKP